MVIIVRKRILTLLFCIVFFTAGCGRATRNDANVASIRDALQPPSLGQVEDPSEPSSPGSSAGTSSPSEDAPIEEPQPTQLSLVMVGDILLHTPVEESALQEDGTYDFDPLFTHTKDVLQDADLAFVNQEVVIGGEELGISGYPRFNAPFAMSDALADAGFDIICHATNHTLDKGKQGLLACYHNWEENYPEIAVLGIHDSEEEAASGPFLYTVEASSGSSADPRSQSFTIAILNYTYSTNGIPLPEDMPYAVDLLEEDAVTADLQLAEELADFTIVCPHWGTEYRLEPDSYQKKWTRIFLENGVDLVLGTHPHVIEPVEWVENEETGDKMLVYYSLGNYVNWTSSSGEGIANRMVGGMAKVTITLNEEGEPVISDYGVDALVCHLEPGVNGVTTYFLSDYTTELAGQNAIISQDPDFSLDYCVSLCDQVWGELWE